MAKRDDFTGIVVRVLGQRAGYFCTNCRAFTVGPHSDPTKPLITGVAAHICAAAPGGPRYEANQTPDERKAITNGLWLCAGCAKKIDTDWKAWPKERLHKMKEEHEQWIAGEGMIPALPVVALTTRPDLRVHPKYLPEITAALQAALREQELVVRNPNRVELFNYSLDLNLPEIVARHGYVSFPTGPVVRFRPIRAAAAGIVSGTGAVTAHVPHPTHQWNLEIDRLPANSEFRIAFYSVVPDGSMPSMPYEQCKTLPNVFKDPEQMDTHKECYFYLDGAYQFLLRGEYVPSTLFVPLLYKAAGRAISSYSVQDSIQPWKVWGEVISSGATLRVGAGGPGTAIYKLC
jgi:hypothetical protein